MNWIWLEDQPLSVLDWEEKLKDIGVNIIRKFKRPQDLTKYLQENKGKIQNTGLIFDCLLLNQTYLTIPKDMIGNNDVLNFKTMGYGHDAGIVYYEKMILGYGIENTVPFWSPLPPIVFLTIIDDDFEEFDERIERIKQNWKEMNDKNVAHVYHIFKFEPDIEKVKSIFDKIEGK
jgi:hypothetical protein